MSRFPTTGALGGDAAEIDLRAVTRALGRRRRVILLPTLVAMAAVGLYVSLVTPRYTAQSQILLENQETFFTRPDRTNPPNEMAQLDEIAVASQVQLIGSPDLARRAIAELKLAGNEEFDPSVSPGLLARLLSLLHITPPLTREAADARIVENFGQKLTVFSPPKTRVVTVEFTSRNAALAARAANTVAELYIQDQSAAKRSQARSAAEALSQGIADLRGKLAKADAERERYRTSSGLLTGANNMTISGQQVAELNGDLSKARAVQADAQAKATMIRALLRAGKAADVAEVTNNDIVRRIWEQRATAQAELALEERTLLPGHPRVKELAAKVAGFDAALKGAAKQAAATLENEAQIAGTRVNNLEAVLALQKTAAGVANGDEVHLHALERVAQGYKEQLESSTTKFEEATARQASAATPADARIISRAVKPQLPSFPKKLPFTLFGGVATLLFTAGCVIAAELLSGRASVAEPSETPAGAGFPDLAAVPLPSALRSVTPFPARSLPDGMFGTKRGSPDSGERRSDRPDRRSALDRRRSQAARRPAPSAAWAWLLFPGRTARGLAAYARRFGAAAHPTSEPDAFVFPPVAPRGVSGVVRPDDVAPLQTGLNAPQAGADNLDALVARIVERHVPGRGLHIVAADVGGGRGASDRLIALSRHLSDKGRALVVDLGTVATKLAALTGIGNEAAATLSGLSELLAGDASFAEVIHRDCLSRLHFIPTGALEADFRDFDLILDALSQTYDFIVLLTPSFPQSEIAKVMAPYADVVVLAAHGDRTILAGLEREMIEAGARDVLVIEPAHAVRDVA